MFNFACSKERVRLLKMPAHLYLNGMRIMLVSKNHVHVTEITPVEPIFLKPHESKDRQIEPAEACGIVMNHVLRYLKSKTSVPVDLKKIRKLWESGRIRVAFSKIQIRRENDQCYLMIVQMPRKYLPVPQAVRTHIKVAAASSLAVVALGILGLHINEQENKRYQQEIKEKEIEEDNHEIIQKSVRGYIKTSKKLSNML